MPVVLPWLSRSLMWLGMYAFGYFTAPKEDKAQLVQPTASQWVWDILKLTLIVFGIIAIYKLIKKQWRF